MSSSFSKSLGKHLNKLIPGPPLFAPEGEVRNMVVYPLFPSKLHPDPPDMVTLSEAMRRGVALNDTGVVSRVHLENPLPTSVLAGESEILIGSTQLRAVQFSCLIPPERRIALPVNCIEEGQPANYQAAFEKSDACPWSLRSYKMAQMAEHGEPPQYWIWDKIKDDLRSSRTVSTTNDLHAILDQNAYSLKNLSPLFPVQPGQVGAVCAVNQDLYLELFADPEILEDRYNYLLRSALVEAVAHPGDKVIPSEMVPQFLNQVVDASQKSRLLEGRGLKDSGRSLAFADKNITGSALVAHGQLIHLSAHQNCLGFSKPFVDQQPDLEMSRQDWEAENPHFYTDLEDRYADRRKRYRAFKDKLKPLQKSEPSPAGMKSSATEEPAADNAIPPLPLSPYLHDFFHQLFRRE